MTVLGNATLSDQEVQDGQIIELVIVIDGRRGMEEDFLVGQVRGEGVVAHEDGDSSISPQFSLPVVHT